MLGRNKLVLSLSGPTFYWLTDFGANASGWIFSMLAVRALSVEDIGNLGFLVNLVTILGIVSASVQIVTTMVHAEKFDNTAFLLGRVCLGVAGVLAIGIGITSWMWMPIFGVVYAPELVFSFMTVVVGTLSLPWLRGILLAEQRYKMTGNWVMVEVVLKILIAVLAWQTKLLWLFVAAMGLSSLLTFWLSGWRRGIWRVLRSRLNSKISIETWKVLIQAIWLRVGVTLLFTVDLVVAKAYLSPEQAGVYALLSLVGKMLFFSVHSFGAILVPLISDPKRISYRLKLVASMELIVVTICLGMIGIFYIWPEYTLKIFLGEKFDLILPYLLMYGLATTVLAGVMLWSLYLLVRKQEWFAWLVLFAVGVEVGLLKIFHDSIVDIVRVLLGVSVLMVLGIGVMSMKTEVMNRKVPAKL